MHLSKKPKYKETKILERMVEPERVIMFRVPWVDDKGEIRINRGYRVQMNSAIGPYKGGIRFHPSVNLGILKFLAFDRYLRTALLLCRWAEEREVLILILRANRE
jgi:glutamate dehydrogenase (NADP+)